MKTPASSRRTFLKGAALAGGGLVIGFVVPGGLRRFAAAQEGGTPQAPSGKLPAPNAFLKIGEDESVTVLLAHSEMGQGIWTTLPMLVNEELDADWSRFRVEHAPAAPPYFSPIFPIQMTGGSNTTSSEFDRYRQVGALTRNLLVAAAATKWGVPADSCRTEKGFVLAGDRKASYGSLASDAAKLPVPAAVELKKRQDWKVIGRATRRLDTPEKVNGSAQFGMDVHLPGMVTAVVAHAPTFGGKVKSLSPASVAKAKALPGVKAILEIPTGVAVVGEHFWAAKRGRDALEIEWTPGPHADTSTVKLLAAYKEKAKTAGTPAAQAGDVEKALAAAASPLTAEYSVPYLAHAPMEPLNCTVQRAADGCEVWAGTQFQTVDQGHVAAIFGLKPEQVKIHTTFLGGGFGRRANLISDFVAEAAEIAKAYGQPVPVKMVWTRPEDIRGGYYRPLTLHRLEGAVDDKGAPVAWRQRIVSQSIVAGSPFAGMIQNGIDPTVSEGAADSAYLASIANRRVDLHLTEAGVPVLWWRSVGHTHTAFAVESFVDELAHAAKRDPLEFRRALLAKAPRLLGVLELAAKKAGWGSPLPAGRARGIAAHSSFGSFAAQVAEVSIEGGAIRVHRVVCAFDCGTVVNPLNVEAQIESAIAFGLGAALHGEVTMDAGRVVESNFHDYKILRLPEMPKVEVHLVASEEKPSGVGEPGTPPIAPAVANAVFALTGKRLRALPFRLA